MLGHTLSDQQIATLEELKKLLKPAYTLAEVAEFLKIMERKFGGSVVTQ